jgi:hypothetical protein
MTAGLGKQNLVGMKFGKMYLSWGLYQYMYNHARVILIAQLSGYE